jgi:hypothetical protein
MQGGAEVQHQFTGERIMKLFYKSFIYAGIAITFLVALIISQDALAGKGGNGGGNAGGGNGGDPEPVYSAYGPLLDVPDAGFINSTNLNFDEIIFRPGADFTVDLSGFSVSDPGGGSCSNFSNTTTGTLVLAPGDAAAPESAELRFGFQGQLSDGGKTVQHYLVMQGGMSGAWPPASFPDTTELTFTSWSISAENKKSQKNDCEGSGIGALVLMDIWLATP